METYSREEVPGICRRRFKLVYQVCMVLMKNVPDAEDAEVWDQVAALPEKLRLVLCLYYYQGYATAEIAQILGDNPATVRSRLAQARKS